ncbi:MAG: GntR family transcriptional regulator, partial [Alphaproteobacteria bacterium]|nr:GntR family transcriptional regulator [Alphaproteobacteria bacterium]
MATRLREAILGGRYAHGERLPAERELTEHFGA